MTGTFKFLDFLTEEEKKALALLREKLAGKTIYFRRSGEDQVEIYFQTRNRKIRRMYQRLKKLGLSDRICFAEISIRLSCARRLSQNRIRHIVKGYPDYHKKAA